MIELSSTSTTSGDIARGWSVHVGRASTGGSGAPSRSPWPFPVMDVEPPQDGDSDEQRAESSSFVT
ncbi:hypothetical protein [Polaromonas sp. YR568]|uniref:hypothetical protein n=1 Tax=Polaromonas sp. YR568 TaxID=1855301 RepID=UPI0031380F75